MWIFKHSVYIGGIYSIRAYVKNDSRLYIQNQYIFNYLCSLIYLIKSFRTQRISNAQQMVEFSTSARIHRSKGRRNSQTKRQYFAKCDCTKFGNYTKQMRRQKKIVEQFTILWRHMVSNVREQQHELDMIFTNSVLFLLVFFSSVTR